MTLEDLTNRLSQIDLNGKNNGSRFTSVLSDYLDDHGAILGTDIRKALIDVGVEKKRTSSLYSPSQNTNLAECGIIKYELLRDVLHRVLGSIKKPEVVVRVIKEKSNRAGDTLIYYKDESRMKEYLQENFEQVEVIVCYKRK